MPYLSRAQNRLVRAAAHNPEVAERTGFSQAAAQKFERDSAGQSLRDLPEHVAKKAEGGPVTPVYPAVFRW